MLSSVRENLKGTLMVVVVIIFIIPMVISGVGTTFMGGASSSDAAEVNGEQITGAELDRAIQVRRNQILSQQGANANTDLLTDEILRTPILQQLTKRLAVVTEGESKGMGMSDAQFADVVRKEESFFTDGEFNQQRYNTALAQSGFYTSAAFRNELKNDLIFRQQAMGLYLSSFVTQTQIEQLVKLTHQKRSFFSATIPVSLVEEKVEITESDIAGYYEANQAEFEVPEKVKVDYLELTVEQLANSIEVSDAEIMQQYEAEVSNFSSDASYEVAHILLEGDSQDKAAEVSEKLAAGNSFEDLAAEYSDDVGSSESGGSLGVLTPGMFPEAFEEAVYALEENQVSDAVETDAGLHFIKVTKKIENSVPSLESRKESIAADIARARAVDEFSALVDSLGELTYFSDNLDEAAEQLGLNIQQSNYFDRRTGSGIADNAKVREAAFDEKVSTVGNNSNTIEISAEQVVVLRLADKKPAYIKSLDEVMPLVEARVKKEKVAVLLEALSEEFIASLEGDSNSQELAEELGYQYESFDSVKRSDFSVDPTSLALAFAAEETDDGLSFNSETISSGDIKIVGVSKVEDGALTDLEDAEKSAFEAQIAQQFAVFDGSSYEALIVEDSDIKVF